MAASQAALTRGEPERAVSILEARLSFAPRDLAATTQLARVWLSLGHPSKAACVLRALPSDVVVDSGYRSALARSLLDTKRTAEAAPLLAALEREGELDGVLLDDLVEQLSEGSWSDPLDRELANVVAAFPAATIGYRTALARSLLDRRRTAEAAPLLAALEREGELDSVLLDDLVEQLAEGSWSDPLDREAASILAAFPAATTARATPAQLEVEHRRLLSAGLVSDATAIEDIFLERYPTDSRSYDIILARSRRLLAQGALEPALDFARRATALDPQHAAPWVQQALALEALGRVEEFRDALDRALAADPTDTAALDYWNRSTTLRDRAPSRRIVVEISP